jgi:hypothetical protein
MPRRELAAGSREVPAHRYGAQAQQGSDFSDRELFELAECDDGAATRAESSKKGLDELARDDLRLGVG